LAGDRLMSDWQRLMRAQER